jgi:hypothetical protein
VQNYNLEREVNKELTGRSPLRNRRSTLDYSVVKKEEDEELCVRVLPEGGYLQYPNMKEKELYAY